MCGICGFMNRLGKNENEIIIEKMLSKITHRGPDGKGAFVKDELAMGNTRLSLVGLDNGKQPIWNEDHTLCLVCNGEIYNYKELKKKMQEKGHYFHTDTDVEVIIHLYEEYGMDFLNQPNGQFAFALYDSKKECLFCARDHVGIAPFFYTVKENIFLFASEIKSLLEYPEVERRIDMEGMDQFFTFPGMISPYTIFEGIKSLEAGAYLVYQSSGKLVKRVYWDLCYPKIGDLNYAYDEEYYVETLAGLLEEAVSIRLQADASVGVYVSGGLDSSLIACTIDKLRKSREIKSFSVEFDQKDISEEEFQSMVVQQIQSEHHRQVVHSDEIARYLETAVYYSESPLKETYNVASYMLSKMVKQNQVKAVLTGEGADELFAGYVGYKFDQYRMMNPNEHNASEEEARYRHKLWGDRDFFYEKPYFKYENTKRKLYAPSVSRQFDRFNCMNHSIVNCEALRDIDIVHKRSYVDFKVRLADHLLSDHGDRMVYANGVEARYPYLDQKVLNFVTQIPPHLKLFGFDGKYILKQIANNCVPSEIVQRPKFSFVAPGSASLLREHKDYVTDILSYDRIKRHGYFNADYIEVLKKEYLMDNYKQNPTFDNDLLMSVLTFELLLNCFSIPDFNR